MRDKVIRAEVKERINKHIRDLKESVGKVQLMRIPGGRMSFWEEEIRTEEEEIRELAAMLVPKATWE